MLLLFFLINPFKKWKQLWYAGIIAMILIYAIDSTLIRLGAFSYQFANPLISGLPTLYWLSSFFGGIIMVKYYPQKNAWKLPYIILTSFLLLLLELIMWVFGYFNYENWTLINSFFLNISGFIILIWLWNWINEDRNKEN